MAKNKRLYDAERYEVLAAAYAKEGTAVSSESIGAYRTKVVQAGAYLYISCYPLIGAKADAEKEDALARLKNGTEQDRKVRVKYAKYNNARRTREFEQLVHANFEYNDFHVSCTYEHQDYERRDQLEYRDREDAKRDATNYIRRVKALLKRHGCGLAEFRWIVCTVTKESRHETNRNPDSHHHHILMHGVPEGLRSELEKLWGFGWCNADRLQPNDKGLAAMAGYIARQEGSANGERPHEKSYRASRNIRRPAVSVSDRKISRRRAAQIAADVRVDGRDVLEKVWPGWRVVEEPTVWVSDFVPGAYIWAKLRKKEDVWDERRRRRML